MRPERRATFDAASWRPPIPFRHVNRPSAPGYDPALQRHHLLPRQLLSWRCFESLFAAVGSDAVGFEDFRRNGMLLPASPAAVIRMGLPLHRGPHHDYNRLTIERVGQIESVWSSRRRRAPDLARAEALMRLRLLQRALRRRLLDPLRRQFSPLNRRDPLGQEANFAELDAMVDLLWPGTEIP